MYSRLSKKELELINQYALKEWLELKRLLSHFGRKNGKSSYFFEEYERLAFEINCKCVWGQFTEIKKIEENHSYNLIDKFKEDTKYGCYLWVNKALSKV